MAFGWLSGALGKDKASTPSTTLAVILSLSTPSGRGTVLVKDRKYLSLLRALPWLPPSSLLSSSSKPRVMPSSDTLSFSLSFGTPGTSAFTTNLSSSSSKSIFGHCCLFAMLPGTHCFLFDPQEEGAKGCRKTRSSRSKTVSNRSAIVRGLTFCLLLVRVVGSSCWFECVRVGSDISVLMLALRPRLYRWLLARSLAPPC